MFCATNNVMHNIPHIQYEYTKYSINIKLSIPQSIAMGLNKVMVWVPFYRTNIYVMPTVSDFLETYI